MKLIHKSNDGRFANVEISMFGKFTCYLSLNRTGAKWPDLSKMFITQKDAVAFCKQRGYIAPVGF